MKWNHLEMKERDKSRRTVTTAYTMQYGESSPSLNHTAIIDDSDESDWYRKRGWRYPQRCDELTIIFWGKVWPKSINVDFKMRRTCAPILNRIVHNRDLLSFLQDVQEDKDRNYGNMVYNYKSSEQSTSLRVWSYHVYKGMYPLHQSKDPELN